MKVINFGSLNLDYVYMVPHFVRPGETLAARELNLYVGGKGLNQSIALSRAGASVWHAGLIGHDGQELKNALTQEGVDTRYVHTVDGPSGHAIIQVTPYGENSILILGGANQKFTPWYVDEVLKQAEPGDYILLQNEINDLPRIMTQAKARGLKVVFNAAPCSIQVNDFPLEAVDLFIINQIEGQTLTGQQSPDAILAAMQHRFSRAATVLTLGEKGACYLDATQQFSAPAPMVTPKDTTGAGDTFTGYFLASLIEGMSIEESLALACQAASICVTRLGAAVSIPKRAEVYAAAKVAA